MSGTGLLRMPRLGETMEEGRLVSWLVEPGTPFERGDPILEVETDKTVVEFPALGAGVVTETLAEIGDTVAVGEPIARVELGEGPDWTAAGTKEAGDAHGGAAASSEASSSAGSAGNAVVSRGTPPAEVVAVGPATRPPTGPLRATPAARRLARQRGLELAVVPGTGRRGRIERQDVETFRAGGAPARAPLGEIACREEGPPAGPPVLFLHGLAGDHSVWSALSAQLARAGRRAVAVDLPGHGATTLEAGDAHELAEGVAGFVAQRWGGAPVPVVAHSLGAVPAVALAERGLARSLTLLAPLGLGHAIDAAFLRGLAAAARPGEVGHLLARMTAGPNGLSEAAVELIAGRLAEGRLVALVDSLLGVGGQAVDLRGRLSRLAPSLPIRLLLGHRDRIIDWRECVLVSPRIAVHHFPLVGHMPQWEALPEVEALLREWTEQA